MSTRTWMRALVIAGTLSVSPFGHAQTPVPRIANGVPTTAYPSVALVTIGTSQGPGQCSGTLVAPGWVLTAAHCLAFGVNSLTVTFSPEGRAPFTVNATAGGVPSEFTLARVPNADVALLHLASAVDIPPTPLATRRPKPGTRATIVGYGLDQLGHSGIRRVATVRVRRCRPAPAAGVPARDVRAAVCWRVGSDGADTCEGDSGGPLLVDGAVAGVTSGGIPGTCPGRLSFDADVAYYRARLLAGMQ